MEHNPIGSKGIQFLCSALQTNDVRKKAFRFIVCIFLIQTITSLKLNWCSIDEVGAHHLSKTLKTHPVNERKILKEFNIIMICF